MFQSIVVISFGAAVGAVIRWLLGLGLNAVLPSIPLGTLAANLIGGYLVGFFISLFTVFPGIAPEWRLLVITGFLGALTTFSTFSAEVVTMLQQQRFIAAGSTVALHVCGSLLMTILGMGSFSLVKHWFR